MEEQLLVQSPTEWIALVSGIIYVILAAREQPVCWLFGIISCGFIAWDDFTSFGLYADGVLQIVYVGLGIVGLYQWIFGRYKNNKLDVHEIPARTHLLAILICAVLSLPVSYLLATYTDARYGFADTLTTLLSLYATWLLARKVISNWLYWIAIDIMYVFLFYRTGGTLIAVLYGVFAVVSVYGYFSWRARHRSASLS